MQGEWFWKILKRLKDVEYRADRPRTRAKLFKNPDAPLAALQPKWSEVILVLGYEPKAEEVWARFAIASMTVIAATEASPEDIPPLGSKEFGKAFGPSCSNLIAIRLGACPGLI